MYLVNNYIGINYMVKIDKAFVLTTKRLHKDRIPWIKDRWKNYPIEIKVMPDYTELGIEEKIKDRKFYNSRLKDNVRKMKEYSLYKNHIALLKEIVEKKLDNILILEDDSYPTKLKCEIDNIKFPSDADILYLGGFFGYPNSKILRHIEYTSRDMIIRIPDYRDNYQIKYWCAHAIYYKSWKKVKQILEVLLYYKPKPFDVLMSRYIHTRFKCFCHLPSVVVQDKGSDLNPKKNITPFT